MASSRKGILNGKYDSGAVASLDSSLTYCILVPVAIRIPASLLH